MFRIWSKSFKVQGYNAQVKTNVFCQLPLLSNNLVLTSYLSRIYLEYGSLGYGMECRKHRRKEEKKQNKNIDK